MKYHEREAIKLVTLGMIRVTRNGEVWRLAKFKQDKAREVLEIRDARQQGASLLLISMGYGISQASASLISRGKSWKHLA